MELALVLPLLVLLLIGVVDIGRAFHTYIVITNAAREGARIAQRIPQNSNAEAYIVATVIQEAAESGVDLSGSAGQTIIKIEPPLEARTAISPIAVTVQYTFTTILGGIVGLEEFPIRVGNEMMLFTGYESP